MTYGVWIYSQVWECKSAQLPGDQWSFIMLDLLRIWPRITGAGWSPFMFQVVLNISTTMQSCCSPRSYTCCLLCPQPPIHSSDTFESNIVQEETCVLWTKAAAALRVGLSRLMGYPNKTEEFFKGSSIRDHQPFYCWSLKEKAVIPETDPVAVSFSRLLRKVEGLTFYKGTNALF